MEWECHLDGINQIREEIDLPTARVVDGSAELLRRVGIGGIMTQYGGIYDTVSGEL